MREVSSKIRKTSFPTVTCVGKDESDRGDLLFRRPPFPTCIE